MSYPLLVVLSGVAAVLAYNPLISLFDRFRRNIEIRHAAEQSDLRRRIAMARIEMIQNAAEQAMWDESLNTYSELRTISELQHS